MATALLFLYKNLVPIIRNNCLIENTKGTPQSIFFVSLHRSASVQEKRLAWTIVYQQEGHRTLDQPAMEKIKHIIHHNVTPII